MRILALEFSSTQRSAAVLDGTGGRCVSEVVQAGENGTGAFGLIEEALKQAQLEREQIECIAVGLGPGSYTGIRIAIAVAQGWQLAHPVKMLGISSAEAVAVQAQTDGITGRFAVVIDAQRREFYLEIYEAGTAGWRPVEGLRLVSREEVERVAEAGVPLVGPEITKIFPGSRAIFPRAEGVGKAALGRTDFVSGEQLEPIYLRQTAFVKGPPTRHIE